MEKVNVNQNRFEEYLLKIEERENALKRKNNLKLIAVMFLMAAGFIGFQHFSKMSKELEKYPLASLTPEKVTELFTGSSEAILVYHPEIGHDTVSSLNDYYQVLNTLDLIEMGRKAYMSAEQETTKTETDSAGEVTVNLDRYIVDVAGERQVGRKLIFTVEDYDDGLNYQLDLGNGVVKDIKKTVVYRYPLPGHFDMKLVALDAEGRSSTYIKKYEIVDPVQTASNQNTTAPATLVKDESDQVETSAKEEIAVATKETF